MRKILALQAALALLLSLASCEWFTKTTDDDTTTTTTAAGTPSDPVMPPLQGGPMLYAFKGKTPYRTAYSEYDGEYYPVYPIGLCNQDGKLVTPPVLHSAEYIYDEAGERVIGLAAVKDREISIYALDGSSRVLPCEGYRIDVYPGGRYATVYTAEGMVWDGGESIEDPLRDGIIDLKENKYVVEPAVGLLVQYNDAGIVFGYQHDTTDATGNETAQWAFRFRNESAGGSIVELPLSLGRVQEYYPETGWFGAMHMEGEWEHRYYDADLQLIPSMSGWSAEYWDGFGGGEYLALYNHRDYPNQSALVNRAGEIFFDTTLKPPPPDDTDPNRPALPDLMAHFPADAKPGDYGMENGAEPMAYAVLTCDDFIVAYAYFVIEPYWSEHVETFAVDWQGNKLADCPLAPYFDSLGWFYNTAGEQGPHYLWIEIEDGGSAKRGYINLKGEWVFVDETAY